MAHGLSCSAACEILPDQGSNPCPLHWQADSQPLHHQGSAWPSLLTLHLLSSLTHSCGFGRSLEATDPGIPTSSPIFSPVLQPCYPTAYPVGTSPRVTYKPYKLNPRLPSPLNISILHPMRTAPALLFPPSTQSLELNVWEASLSLTSSLACIQDSSRSRKFCLSNLSGSSYFSSQYHPFQLRSGPPAGQSLEPRCHSVSLLPRHTSVHCPQAVSPGPSCGPLLPDSILTREVNHAGPVSSEDNPAIFLASPVAFPSALLSGMLSKSGLGPWLRPQPGPFLWEVSSDLSWCLSTTETRHA